MLRRVWDVRQCLECYAVSGLLRSVWDVRQCLGCYAVSGMLRSVWDVTQCLGCYEVSGMLRRVWDVTKCLGCYAVSGMLRSVWDVTKCLGCYAVSPNAFIFEVKRAPGSSENSASIYQPNNNLIIFSTNVKISNFHIIDVIKCKRKLRWQCM
jgi:hypothetical protein